MGATDTVFHQLPDLKAAADAVAAVIATELKLAISERGSASFVLAGGSTPKGVYERLAGAAGSELEWSKVHIFWGDERCVGPHDAANNYRLAFESLLESLLEVDATAPENIHRIEGELGAAQAANNYDAALRNHFGPARWPTFDLVLLGMGADGHTASLFPGEPLLSDRTSWVGTSNGQQASPPVPRVSLTLGALNAARRALFLVAGDDKLILAEEIRREAPTSLHYPAALVRPAKLDWYLAGADINKDEPRVAIPS